MNIENQISSTHSKPRPNLTSPAALNHNDSLYPFFYSIELFSFSSRMGAESRLSERRQESATKFTLGDDPAKNTKLNDKNRANPVILSKTSVLSVFSVVQKMALNRLCFGLNWLCIGFELALFFLASQLPILTYQSIKKALTAFFQMLRLALFSQTNPKTRTKKPSIRKALTTMTKTMILDIVKTNLFERIQKNAASWL